LNQAYSNWEISEEDFQAPQEPLEESSHSLADAELNTSDLEQTSVANALSEDHNTQPHTDNKKLESSAAKETHTTTAKDSATEWVPASSIHASHQWPWTVTITLLILILLAQVLHHYRLPLAKDPLLGPQVQALYETLGQPLPRVADITRYTSTLTGMVSDPQSPGTLSLQAVIANQATDAQPYPWISIRLENRFGTPVGARIFKPEEYLTKAAKNQIMAAGVSESVRLAIVDPGQDAVGVKLDTCLPLSIGLRCSHEGQQ
jgi:hypothetical protein